MLANKPAILYKRGALWLVFLGPFFFLSYGAVNYFTSTRHDIGILVQNWEHHIPFVPWLMLPYMSIDAFYAASLFLFRQKNQLDLHAKRLLLATVISLIGFLLFPLQFSFAVPKADGFNGLLQAALLGFDKPYNQAPSMHISLLVVLWACYCKKLQAFSRLALHSWFTAIGASVLLVYQHHFIDVWTGALAGLLVMYVLPNKPHNWCWLKPTKVSINIGLRYTFGSALLIFLVYILWPISGFWIVLLCWIKLSLLLVALAYFGFNQCVFQRYKGLISWPAKCLLAPYLLGNYLSYVFYTRKLVGISQITNQVYLGCFPKSNINQSISIVIDLTNEFSQLAVAQAKTFYFPMLDLVPPSPTMLAKAVVCLNNQQNNSQQKTSRPKILVHCALGLSRSACVVVCWLVWRGHAKNIEAAIAQVAKKRAGLVLSKQHITHIKQALTLLK